MTTLLIYQDAVALDRDRHRALKLKPTDNARFAATAHVVPLVAVEFAEAAREYPIVFARGAGDADTDGVPGELLCFALTGTHEDVNLYLDAAGRWDADYVPAFIRRYPFVYAQTGTDQLTVCIDETYPGFDDSEGEPLFDAAGEAAPLLKNALKLLTDYQQQVQLTGSFLKKLDASGLLMEAQLEANFPDGRRALVQGMLVVDETKLKQLPPATLQEWFVSGELGLIYAHLLSLGNLSRLVQRMPGSAPENAPASLPSTAKSSAPVKKRKGKAE
jgi:hypothetical protein